MRTMSRFCLVLNRNFNIDIIKSDSYLFEFGGRDRTNSSLSSINHQNKFINNRDSNNRKSKHLALVIPLKSKAPIAADLRPLRLQTLASSWLVQNLNQLKSTSSGTYMGTKNKWFKHYNTAMGGDTLQQFIANRDYECVVLFWALLEILSRTESEESRGETQIEIKFLAREINMKPTKIIKLLSRFVQIALEWNLTVNGTQIKFRVPNWLELQETRGGKRSPKESQNLTEVRSKKLEVRSKEEESSFLEGLFFKRLSLKVKESLLKFYSPEFLEQSMIEIEAYLDGEGHRFQNKIDTFIPASLQRKWDFAKAKETQARKPSPFGMVSEDAL